MLAHRFTIAAVLGAALALPAAPAHAQFGKILKKAAEKVAVDKAVEKTTEKVGGDSSATRAQTPANPAQGAGVQGAPAAGGRAGARRTTPVYAATGTTEELIQKAVSYDQAYAAALKNLLDTDPRFASFKKARADYERCYAKDAAYDKGLQRYQRLMEQARLDENDAAYKKWSDSLVAAQRGKAANAPAGCQIPELSSALARAARDEATKSAEAKAGTSEGALAGFRERSEGYLRLSSSAERQKAVSSGAYSAADAAAFDRNRDALVAWMSRSGSDAAGTEPDPKAVAQYEADMERYERVRETYEKCVEAANASGGSAGTAPAMTQAQMAQAANTKPPTEAQMADAQRLSKLAEAAHKRGDNAKAMVYADSMQKVLGLKAMQATPEQQQYANQSIASHKKMMAAMKKCGAPPEMPVKPAYMR